MPSLVRAAIRIAAKQADIGTNNIEMERFHSGCRLAVRLVLRPSQKASQTITAAVPMSKLMLMELLSLLSASLERLAKS